MNILITGGAGFIGSNLAKELLKTNNKIISLDNYSTGSTNNHIDNTNITYINGNTWDILDIFDLKNFKPELIFHFGEFSRIPQSFDEPSKVFKSNSLGTQQILQYAVMNNSKLIYSGSSAIFGNNGDDQNLNPYAWTKSKNIELIHNYKDWFNLNFAICYFYNVYGNGQITKGTYATVIGIFEDQYKNNQPLTIVKPGSQSRIFTHIDDIINGVLLISKNGIGNGYHLGAKKCLSILEVAKMFDTEYIFIKERKGERNTSLLHSDKTEIELGWKAKNKLYDYIKGICK